MMKAHRFVLFGLLAIAAFSACALAETEIPRTGMVATASAGSANPASNALDGLWTTAWRGPNKQNAWIRIDMLKRYRLTKITYAPHPTDGYSRFKNYSIYVTDVDSTVEADWGAPELTGTNSGATVKDFTFPAADGRYLIMSGTYDVNYCAAAEIWMYGSPADTSITSFTVSDPDTGSTTLTDGATVNVSLTAAPVDGTIAGYIISETDDIAPPVGDARWNALPASYDITASQGNVTVYAWVKDSLDNIAGATHTICYSTNVPTISNASAAAAGPYSIDVSWDTDSASAGYVAYGVQGGALNMTTALTDYGTSHLVSITGLPYDGTTYDLEIHANGVTEMLNATTDPAARTSGAVTWAGAQPDSKGWSRGANWVGKQPPAEPSTGVVTFYSTGSATDASVTSLLDPATPDATSWQIGGLQIRNPEGGTVANMNHHIDLGGKTLIVAGDLGVNYYPDNPQVARQTVTARFSNGTLQVDVDGAPRNIYLARGWYNMVKGDLIMAAGTSFQGYINTIFIGDGQNGPQGVFDLRDSTIVGGTLKANNIYLGRPQGLSGLGAIYLNANSNLQNIEVAKDLWIGNGHQVFKCYIGDPGDNWKLPANVNVKVGSNVEGTITRGSLIIAQCSHAGTSDNSRAACLNASSGGLMEAYVTDLIVGKHNGGYGYRIWGEMDLRPMTSVTIDAQNVYIGCGKPGSSYAALGYVYLPPGSSVTTNTLSMGEVVANNVAVLDLDDCTMAVNTSIALRQTATATVHVRGRSCGFDLVSDATITGAGNGKIHVVFEKAQNEGEVGPYYGLRWDGDHQSELQTLATSGNITWDFSAIGEGTAAPYFDASTGYTYLMHTSRLPLVAIANDLSIEIAEGGTVTLAAEDIDGGSNDPNGGVIVSYEITCAQDEIAGDEFVTLTGYGEFLVTLTVKNDADPQESASDTALITLAPIAATTLGDVIWSGGASLTEMARPEWYWGANWEGGSAPDNPTTATVLFTDKGVGTNLLDADRTVGSLQVRNPSGGPCNDITHTFDLGGNRLIVNGMMGVAYHDPSPGEERKTVTARFENGTLQIGTPEVPRDIRLGKGWYNLVKGDLVMGENSLFEGYINNIIIGEGMNGPQGVLDLRGCTIVGGTLKANNIDIGQGNDLSALGAIYVDDASGL